MADGSKPLFHATEKRERVSLRRKNRARYLTEAELREWRLTIMEIQNRHFAQTSRFTGFADSKG